MANQPLKTHDNVFCGEIIEIFSSEETNNSIAMINNIKPTIGHYHKALHEIYFMVDGTSTLQLYDPETKRTWEHQLNQNEAYCIRPGIHHRLIKTSDKNRLCVICTPPWHPDDEYASDILK